MVYQFITMTYNSNIADKCLHDCRRLLDISNTTDDWIGVHELTEKGYSHCHFLINSKTQFTRNQYKNYNTDIRIVDENTIHNVLLYMCKHITEKSIIYKDFYYKKEFIFHKLFSELILIPMKDQDPKVLAPPEPWREVNCNNLKVLTDKEQMEILYNNNPEFFMENKFPRL